MINRSGLRELRGNHAEMSRLQSCVWSHPSPMVGLSVLQKEMSERLSSNARASDSAHEGLARSSAHDRASSSWDCTIQLVLLRQKIVGWAKVRSTCTASPADGIAPCPPSFVRPVP